MTGVPQLLPFARTPMLRERSTGDGLSPAAAISCAASVPAPDGSWRSETDGLPPPRRPEVEEAASKLTKVPRYYQAAADVNAWEQWQRGIRSTLALAATGTGK